MRYTSFPSSFFSANREALIAKLPCYSMALLFSGSKALRNADQFYPFRIESNFFYLTGLQSPDLALLLVKEEEETKTILFIPDIDPRKEQWEGKQLTKEQAQAQAGIKQVLSSNDLLATVFRLQVNIDSLYTLTNEVFPDIAITKEHSTYALLRKRLPGLEQKKLLPLCSQLRSHKKKEEIQAIEEAIAITHRAFSALIKVMKPNIYEYELEAELMHTYIQSGCDRVGFDPIVASGENATALHYITNDSILQDKQLVLIDTGGEKGMYTSDITRVFPVNGKFTERQRHCYQAVLEVNKRFITMLEVGQTWKQIQEMASQLIGETYAKYGFITNAKEHISISVHSIGHALGLDVHDQGRQRSLDLPLQEGTVLTVEPGLYLPQEGIGIRIEDNVAFTKQGTVVLSSAIPKEIEEVESWIAEVKQGT